MPTGGRSSVRAPASGEAAAARARRRQGMFLASPGALYLLIFFVVPLGLISVYSFATRTSTGRTSLSGWNVESYRVIGDDIILGIIGRSHGWPRSPPRCASPSATRSPTTSPPGRVTCGPSCWCW